MRGGRKVRRERRNNKGQKVNRVEGGWERSYRRQKKSFCRTELLETEEKKVQLGFDDNFVDSLLCRFVLKLWEICTFPSHHTGLLHCRSRHTLVYTSRRPQDVVMWLRRK